MIAPPIEPKSDMLAKIFLYSQPVIPTSDGGGGNNGAASVRTYPACASTTDEEGFFAPVLDGAVLIVFLAILALHQFYAAVKPVHERRGQ